MVTVKQIEDVTSRVDMVAVKQLEDVTSHVAMVGVQQSARGRYVTCRYGSRKTDLQVQT